VKRVLVIAYYWPPAGGSGVQRWVKFAKYLPADDWAVTVYTPSNPEYTAVDRTLEAEVSPLTEVIRRPIVEPYGIYRRLMGKGSSTDMKTLTAAASGGAVTEISSGRKSWKQKLSLWIRGNVFVPDPRVGWVRPSVRYLKKFLSEHPVDVIVTTGPPHSMHLIGQKLHRDLGIPWVADFRDPWTRMYYLKYLPLSACTWKKLRRQEQSVLDECSCVLACTPFVQKEFQAQTSTPVACITNGFDEEDFACPAPVPDGYFNITHTGLFASDGNPLELWKVLGSMASSDASFKAALRLRLVGKVDQEVLDAISAAGLADNIVTLGYCDHATAIREQRAATVLILPLRNDPEYRPILPGKLFEYLAAARPVLGIGQTDGAMAMVLTSTGAGTTAAWEDSAAMKAFMEHAWQQFRSGDSLGPKGPRNDNVIPSDSPVIPSDSPVIPSDFPVIPSDSSVIPSEASVSPDAGGVSPVSGDISAYSRRATAHALAQLLSQVSARDGDGHEKGPKRARGRKV